MCNEISRQVFPIEIDLDNPRWKRNLKRIREAFEALDRAKKRGGFLGFLQKIPAGVKAGSAFLSLYFMPTKKNKVPANPRLQPTY